MEVVEVEFNGVVFRRYPDAKGHAERMYFVPGSTDRIAGIGRLHEEIWKATHGEIPAGHHVHHIDFDALNNSLENLLCLPASEHQAIHAVDPKRLARLRSPESLKHLEEIRPLAAQWHGSEEGLRWHSEHGKQSWDREPTARECAQCGGEYFSKLPGSFCSNKCKSKARRASGIDGVERSCVICKTVFIVNKYKRTLCCSRRCAAQLSGQTKRQ